MFEVIPIPAFRDNYIWLLWHRRHAVVVDPGDAMPVLEVLRARNLGLEAILITHHHDDHVGGVERLLASFPAAAVYTSAKETYPFPHHAVAEGDTVRLPGLNTRLHVMETPGHTLGHVVYYGANCLFCGDTLFGCGCGRLFDGTCQQLFHSLQRLAALPPETRIYCAHEYTLHNIRFACTIDPDNEALINRYTDACDAMSKQFPTLPSTLAMELATNPFLRCNTEAIQAATGSAREESAFCALRSLRNSF